LNGFTGTLYDSNTRISGADSTGIHWAGEGEAWKEGAMGGILSGSDTVTLHQGLSRGARAAIAALIVLTGCGGNDLKKWSGEKRVRHEWYYPTRQDSPEVVYNRLKEVRPPEPIPEPPQTTRPAPVMVPVVQLDFENTSLERAANVMGEAYRYTAHCAPSVAQRTISIRAVGTLDELAQRIGAKTGVRIVVDHQNREIRVLGGSGKPAPRAPEAQLPKATPQVRSKSVVSAKPTPKVFTAVKSTAKKTTPHKKVVNTKKGEAPPVCPER
jgi:hypothetical protein